MYGIRESASDIDLCVSMELFDKLKEKYGLDDSKKNNCDFYKINDLIEIIPNDKKDLKDIEKITTYLEKKLIKKM